MEQEQENHLILFVNLTLNPLTIYLTTYFPNSNITMEKSWMKTNTIDRDYKRSRKSKEVYLNNLSKPRIEIDNISQTVNSLMEREDVECQTSNVTTCMAGTQIHNFNIIDTFNEMDVKQDVIPPSTIDEESTEVEIRHAILADRQLFDDENDSMNDGAAEDYHPDTIMFLERILAQNSLDVKLFWSNDIEMKNPENDSHLESLLDQNVFGLTYCFTLTLLGDADKGLAVRCKHWNETGKHLLAVVYSNLMYTDYADKQYAYVAVWSTKNQHTPERLYEFNTSAITCLKFTIKTPNNLAIGFDCGIIQIIDISKKSLNIVFQTSTNLSLETTSISVHFWTTNTENKIPHEVKSECLVRIK
eukprot:XP_016661225.1 PREDICTED: WD repeat-containing protein 78-like isoform X2 [Acyrthosiphon pisum]